MRFALAVTALVVAAGCDDCVEEPIRIAEGEGEPLPTEGEGEDVGEGEGEGEVVGEGEGEGEGEGDVDPGCVSADLSDAGGADKDRVLLIGFPFAAGGTGARATDVGAFAVDGLTGAITGAGDRVAVGFLPDRIAFLPSGKFAVVVGESLTTQGQPRPADQMALIDVRDPDDLRVVDTVDSGVFGFKDVVFSSTVVGDAVVGYAVNFDSSAGGGVHPFRVSCDGIAIDADDALARRLSSSLALLPGDRGLLLGGQVTGFDPRDAFDIRLLDLSGGGAVEEAAFDVFLDDVVASRIGAAADGSFAVIPNNALFSDENGVVVVVDIDGDTVTERGRIDELASASEAIVAPDGSVAAVSQFEPGVVTILDVSGAGDPTVATTLTGLGLAEQMAMIGRGTLSGRVYVPVVSPREGVGSSVAAFDLGGGTAAFVGDRFDLGEGTENTPIAVAISP